VEEINSISFFYSEELFFFREMTKPWLCLCVCISRFLASVNLVHAFDPNLALPDILEDEWGCAIEEGYFWCGSSSRCLQGDDVCEDGLGDAVKCQVEHKGLLWDLSHLRKSSALDYAVKATGLKDVEVNFNLCANAATPVEQCLRTEGTNGEIMDAPAPGYAWEINGDGCKRLGESIKARENFEMKVLDEMAPLKGISITYTGGNTCPAHELYQCENDVCRHSLQVTVYCHNTHVDVPELEPIEIAQPCTYKLDIHSVHGCPIECPRDYEGKICSDRGMCKAKENGDTGDYKVVCLCEEGFTGEYCQNIGAAAPVQSSTVVKYKAILALPNFWDELFLTVGAWVLAAILLLVVWRYKIHIWRCWIRIIPSKGDVSNRASFTFEDTYASSKAVYGQHQEMSPFQKASI